MYFAIQKTQILFKEGERDQSVPVYATSALLERDLNSIAVVGTRRPTSYGETVVKNIVSDLAANGVTIVSGLAFGIDSMAHESALAVGGRTLAVLASGINNVTPRTNEKLAKKIVGSGQGALVSEYEPNAEAFKWSFIQRDHLMARISKAVLVIEAGENSGTQHTVDAALGLGKQVFSVPGSVFNEMSVGTNRYIQEGAHLTVSAQDIFDVMGKELLNSASVKVAVELSEDLGGVASQMTSQAVNQMTKLERQVFEALSFEPVSINELSQRLSVPISLILVTLTNLEAYGLVKIRGNLASRC